MTITITDPSLLAQLKAIVPGAVLCGPNGEFLAELSRPYGMPPPGHVPPVSDEEIAKAGIGEGWRGIFSRRSVAGNPPSSSMKYRIRFKRSALNELANAWLAASDRNAVSQASYRLDKALSDNADNLGESRESNLTRVIVDFPIRMLFDIVPDDNKVIVRAVWLVR